MVFNQNITGDLQQAKVTVNGSDPIVQENPTIEDEGNAVTITSRVKVAAADNDRNGKVEIVISGVTYEATFVVPGSSLT